MLGQVSIQVADGTALPFKDNQFDVVIREFVSGLLEDKPQAARE